MARIDAWTKGIGPHRGAPRVFLDGAEALRAGFAPGEEFVVDVGDRQVLLRRARDGSRTLSSVDTVHGGQRVRRVASRKRRDGTLAPVIDINSRELLAMFEGMSAVRVIVTEGEVRIIPLATEIARVERLERAQRKVQRGEPLTMGSISHGGGILTRAIHEGMAEAGLETSLAFANEIRSDLLEHALRVNPAWGGSTSALGMPMQELAADEYLLAHLPQIEVLEAGIPCSAASRAGKAKLGSGHAEAHEEVGHLVHAFLILAQRTNSTVILVENVPTYAHTASACIMRNQLRDLGYVVHEAIVSGRDHGCIEDRVRWCMVAVTRGMSFDFKDIEPRLRVVRRLDDILDHTIGRDDPRWVRADHLAEKAARDASAGKGFKMQFIRPEDTSIPTIRKGYQKAGSVDPRLVHPSGDGRSRLLTAEEHARAKGVPTDAIEGLSELQAHQMLGQSIAYDPFVAVGARIAQSLKALAERLRDDVVEHDGGMGERIQRMVG